MSSLTIRVDKKTRDDIKVICHIKNISQAELIRILISGEADKKRYANYDRGVL